MFLVSYKLDSKNIVTRKKIDFMYTVYKGEEYRFSECFVYNGKYVSGISTSDIKKIDNSFKYKTKGKYYYKFLDEAELSDKYDVSFSAEYDTGSENLGKEWNILTSLAIDPEQKRIHLINVDYYLPGWTIEEKGVYTKWINVSEFSNFKIVYKYFIKDGAECNPPVIEKDVIEYTDDDDIIKKMLAIFEYYKQI